MLNIVDEFTRECLAIKVARKLNSMDVIETLAALFLLRGMPAHIRSDQGPKFIAEAVKSWIGWGSDRLHRARQSVGERLRGELQRATAR